MTCLSLATVRLTNPNARIEIACDQQTHQALLTTGSQLLREADVVRDFPTPDGPPTFRNRFVKTRLRLLVSGPFLFLDSDTVVRKPLTPLFNLEADIAAAPNHSSDTLAEQIWSEDQANLYAMGWQVREPYVNGGVIWYADTPGSHRFAETWHRNWLLNVKCTGRHRDQTALNYSLTTTPDLILNVLPFVWHAYSTLDFSARRKDLFYQLIARCLMQDKAALSSFNVQMLIESASPFPLSQLNRTIMAVQLLFLKALSRVANRIRCRLNLF